MRRLPLLSLLASLCLLALTGPAAPTAVLTHGGNAVSAAVSDAAIAVRTLPDRLTPTPHSTVKRVVPLSATLPAAVLVALLLAVQAVRRRRVADAPLTLLPTAAGRGPPSTS